MQFYYYWKDGDKHGPYSGMELKGMGLHEDMQIWHYGLANWTTASKIPELKQILINLKSQRLEPIENKTNFFRFQRMFEKPFSFTGRIRRSEYGLSFIILFISSSFYTFFFSALLIIFRDVGIVLVAFLSIPFFWFILAQGTKRCHDLGHSGWYQIIPFYFLWLIFADGEAFENTYGYNPKAVIRK